MFISTQCSQDVTEAFLQQNSLQCLVRSHEETREGCHLNHPGCYTVFSAPNRSKGVLGGVITIHKEEEEERLRMESYVFAQTDSPGNEPGI